MAFTVTINLPAFNASVARQVEPIMEEALNEITTIIGEQADEPKSGRIYRAGRRASAPGESPARQTGELIASITEPQVVKAGKFVVGQIRITAPYAIRLQRGIGIAKRPIVEPAIAEFMRRHG